MYLNLSNENFSEGMTLILKIGIVIMIVEKKLTSSQRHITNSFFNKNSAITDFFSLFLFNSIVYFNSAYL